MLVINEQRHQFLYFFLSGVVASVILLLIYFSVRASISEQLQDDLKQIQKTLTYTQPNTAAWNYNNTWRTIGNVTRRELIYAAYFDARIDVVERLLLDDKLVAVGSLRVFAVLPQRFRDTLSCVLRYDDFTQKEVPAEVAEALHESHTHDYAVWSIMCPLRHPRDQLQNQAVRLPQAVALVYSANRLGHVSPTFVTVSYPRNFDDLFAKSQPALAICVGPLQLGYADALRIAEFVEMYRLMGARHFYFYLLDANAEVMRLLQHYRDEGLADVLNWQQLGAYDENELHYGGIFGAINDCVYRTAIVDNYRYAAVVDLDELLMPLKHNSLMEYLRQCDEGRTSCYMYRNVFFNRKDSNDVFSIPPGVRNHRLYAQTKIRRTVEVMPPYTRSKCIVNARSIVKMGNHQVWRSLPGYTETIVHPSVGLLFHYRDKCVNCKSALMVDYSARRFGSLIWSRIDAICQRVYPERNGQCPYS